MSKHEEILVIEISSMALHADSCNGCDGSEDLKRLDFRIGWNASSSIVWCKNCRAKVASFLAPEMEQRLATLEEHLRQAYIGMEVLNNELKSEQ